MVDAEEISCESDLRERPRSSSGFIFIYIVYILGIIVHSYRLLELFWKDSGFQKEI